MKVFITGGCKNGKSYRAVKLAVEMGAPRYYIATMKPSDGEDDARIARHRAEREGLGFTTIEAAGEIGKIPERCDTCGVFLLDSVTALLANEMFGGNEYYPDAHHKVINDVLALMRKTPNIIIVSDYIYSDAFVYDDTTERYRKGLGLADRAIAAACDACLEVSFGRLTVHKNAKGFVFL